MLKTTSCCVWKQDLREQSAQENPNDKLKDAKMGAQVWLIILCGFVSKSDPFHITHSYLIFIEALANSVHLYCIGVEKEIDNYLHCWISLGAIKMCFFLLSKIPEKLANQLINIYVNLTGNNASIILLYSILCSSSHHRFYALCTQHSLHAI